jgi:predicted RNase H-like HicB family nuclease
MTSTTSTSTVFAHNTEFSGNDNNVPVISFNAFYLGEDIKNWHEASSDEYDTYLAYWNTLNDAVDEGKTEDEARAFASEVATTLIGVLKAKAEKQAAIDAVRDAIVAKPNAAQRRAIAEVAEYRTYKSYGDIKAMQHYDGRTLVFDDFNKKVLKRFRAGDFAWNNADRYADDYRFAHRFDESPALGTLVRSGLAPADS